MMGKQLVRGTPAHKSQCASRSRPMRVACGALDPGLMEVCEWPSGFRRIEKKASDFIQECAGE